MHLFESLIFVFLISFTLSLPTCKISYWVNSKNFTCSASPNGTYSGLVYNGSCALSPDDPKRTSYRLLIDVETKTVQNFTVYADTNCKSADEVLFTTTPLSLNTCGPLFFVITSTNSERIGSLNFDFEN